MPVALPIFTWEMRDMVRVVRATKVEPRPKPWINRGHQAVAEIDLGYYTWLNEINGHSR